MEKSYKRYFLLFALPTLIVFFITFIIPFILGIGLSFTKWNSTFLDASFNGFNNYIEAFKDTTFLNAFWFTTRFTIVSVITINVFAFLLALLLTSKIKGKSALRSVFFMPNLIGGVVLGYIWQVIINAVLNNYGLTLTMDAKYGFWGLVILMNWQLIGYMMIIYIAGIQTVDNELIEAAKVDGANAFQRLRHIIIPSVMPAITICLFLTLSNSFKLYDQNMALTAGGPMHTTEMLALNIVDTIYNQRLPGVGQAKAVIFFILISIISLIQVKITRRKEVEV